ncbi:MAG TPA: hypothetical protein VGU23_03285, partial [Acidobacteriaceae bacterium]|nr:hypothetical protein [Acidobacteriaceae bacterium]
GLAATGAWVGIRALRRARTVEIFERPKQPYMLQVHPPSDKVRTMELPARREPDRELPREKQA